MVLGLLPLLLSLVGQAPAAAEPPRPMLWLATNGYHSDRPGGGSSAAAKAIELNKPLIFATYSTPNMCGFAAGARYTDVDPVSELGWVVRVMPTTVTADHVVLNVTWVRKRGQTIEARGSADVLIRRGDIVPLDVAMTPEKRGDSGCGMTSAQVSLELDPVTSKYSGLGGSVVSTDMWLVRRLSDGKEATQQINIRGALDEEVPFYFDDAKHAELMMSVLGTVRARDRGNGAIALEFSAERQLRNGTAQLKRGFTSLPPGSGPLVFGSAQDVVSVEFPLSTDPTWKEFGSEALSIRIRTRRIR